jgi:hypothetical protein
VENAPLRVLLSEGSSTSAREALTLLAAAGHEVEICDPDIHCLARFSRFHSGFHHCPGLRDDPAGYLDFIENLLSRRSFDVLLPIHEQGMLFARVASRLVKLVGLAVPSFASYRVAHSKVGFVHLLDELGLPQPPTRHLRLGPRLPSDLSYPCVLKTAIGTASRGTFVLRSAAELEMTWRQLREDEIRQAGAMQDDDAANGGGGGGGKADGEQNAVGLLLQDFVAGGVEHAQAVFRHGELLGFHAYAQILAGAGGGDAVKESISRPQVRVDLARLGARLEWHGALSLDYIHNSDGTFYIDCNPRLVEPVNATLSGVDLIGLLLAVSLGENPAPQPDGCPGTRSHLALQALLGVAQRERRRGAVLAMLRDVVARRGVFRGSIEELSPAWHDWPSALPVAAAVLCLMVDPRLAGPLARHGWGAHLLTPRTIAEIEAMVGKDQPTSDISGDSRLGVANGQTCHSS